MGNLMRRYWVPVMLASEIAEPDGPPVRVKILGERLLAFRDKRGAPWPDRRVLRAPRPLAVPRPQRGRWDPLLVSRMEVRHHRSVHRATVHAAPRVQNEAHRVSVHRAWRHPLGLHGAFRSSTPAPPELEWCLLPPSHRYVTKRLQETGYLQAMEGGIDTTHASWVHRYELDRDPMHKHAEANKYIKADRNAVFDVQAPAARPHDLRAPQRRGRLALLARHAIYLPLVHADPALWGRMRWAAISGFPSTMRTAGLGASTFCPTGRCPMRNFAP